MLHANISSKVYVLLLLLLLLFLCFIFYFYFSCWVARIALLMVMLQVEPVRTVGTLIVVVMLHMQLSVPTADLGLLVVTAVGQLAVVTLTLSHHTRRLASSQW